MSALKNCLSIKKWHVNICLDKKVQQYSKVLGPQHFSDQQIQKLIHQSRFYSSDKCEQKINSINVENINSSNKLQNVNSVIKMESQINYSGIKATVSVAVIGGAGTLTTFMLLKQNPAIKEIRLIDTDDSLSLSICDVKQIDTTAKIRHYKRNSVLDGLRNIDLVILMDETNLIVSNTGPFSQFVSSSSFAKQIAECMATACPNAVVVVFTHPVTAIVPLVSEIYKKYNVYNPSKIIGSASLYSMRITAMTAKFLDLDPSSLKIPITGGADSLTFVPLLSKTTQFDNLITIEDQHTLIQQLKLSNDYVFEFETHASSLIAGLAANKLISSLVCGIQNRNDVCVANAFVRSNIYPSCQYMASKVQFGPEGIQQIFDLPKITPYEISLIEQNVPMINRIVDSGKYFAQTGNVK